MLFECFDKVTGKWQARLAMRSDARLSDIAALCRDQNWDFVIIKYGDK